MNPFVILLFIIALIYAGYRLIKKEAIITVLKKEVFDLKESLNSNVINISSLKSLENTINQLRSTNLEYSKEIHNLKSKVNVYKANDLKIVEVIDPMTIEPNIEISSSVTEKPVKKKRIYKKKP